MITLFKEINRRINGLVWSLVSTGVILLLLSILIVWTDFVLRLVVGLMVLVLSYALIFAGWKLWTLKKEIEKHFGL